MMPVNRRSSTRSSSTSSSSSGYGGPNSQSTRSDSSSMSYGSAESRRESRRRIHSVDLIAEIDEETEQLRKYNEVLRRCNEEIGWRIEAMKEELRQYTERVLFRPETR
jgi:hypothetical protein